MERQTPATTRQVLALKTGADTLIKEWLKIREERPLIAITFGYNPRKKDEFVYETAMALDDIGLIIPLQHKKGSDLKNKPIQIKSRNTGLIEHEFTLPIQELVTDHVFEECYRECYTILVASTDNRSHLAHYGEYWARHGDRVIAKIERGDYDGDKK